MTIHDETVEVIRKFTGDEYLSKDIALMLGANGLLGSEPLDPPKYGCPTPGCGGDGRYGAPGRGHMPGCTYPLEPNLPSANAAPDEAYELGYIRGEADAFTKIRNIIDRPVTWSESTRLAVILRQMEAIRKVVGDEETLTD